jgi:hypothetical protein
MQIRWDIPETRILTPMAGHTDLADNRKDCILIAIRTYPNKVLHVP